jgi:hypothetical protein
MIVGFVYFASLALTTLRLNTAVAETALMLGQDQGEMRSDAELQDMVCSLSGLSDCAERLAIRVEPMDGFADEQSNTFTPGYPGIPRTRILTMKMLTARYDTGADLTALSRLVFGETAKQDEIRASAIFVSRGS